MIAELDLIDSLPVAAFVTDGEGRVIRHNAAAAALWGRSPAPGTARWSGAWRLLATDARRSIRRRARRHAASPRDAPLRRPSSSLSGRTAAGRPSWRALPCSPTPTAGSRGCSS
jgi:two-component system CheB/CheR fusion protein